MSHRSLTRVLGPIAASAAVLLGSVAAPITSQASTTSAPLLIAYPGAPRTLNSWQAYDYTSDAMILNVYDQLITYAQVKVNGQVQGSLNAYAPMLATSWTSNANHTVYTFNLRHNAMFSNGDHLTSADVVWTYDHGMKANGNLGFLSAEGGIKTVTAPGPYQVQITLAHPDPMFLSIIAMYPFSILDSKVAATKPATYWNTHELGSGPYELQSLDPSSQAVFVPNPHYWGPKPHYQKVILKFITDAAVRQQLVQSGGVQVAMNLSPLALQTLAKAPGIKEHTNLSEDIVFFAMNERDTPFQSQLVRQALAYAIPYSTLINQVELGQASPLNSPVPVGMPTHTGAGWNYSYNLQKAKSLLQQAGYKNGFSFTFTLDSSRADWVQDATLMQSSFAKIGVKMKIVQVSDAEYLTLENAHKMQAFIEDWTSFVNDPGYHLGFLVAGGMATNASNYNNPTVNSLLKQAEFDPNTAQRNGLYTRIQTILNQQVPFATLYQYKWTVVTYGSLSGYIYYPDELLRFWTFK